MNESKRFTVEYRDFLGWWRFDREVSDLETARQYCVEMADVTGVAYRILEDGKQIGTIDLEAEFFRLDDQETQS